jgi:hypothetical protein
MTWEVVVTRPSTRELLARVPAGSTPWAAGRVFSSMADRSRDVPEDAFLAEYTR